MACLLSLAVTFLAVGCSRGAAKPNIVLIVVDSLRADDLGCYGAKSSVSPSIDRFAREGLRFERAVAQAPWNMPSISSLVTSCYPSQHGQGAASGAGVEMATLAETLSKNGYRTAAFSEVAWPLLQRGFEKFENTAIPHLYGDPQTNSAEKTFGAAREWMRDAQGPFFVLVHTYEVHSYFMSKPHAQALAKRENPAYKGRFVDWGIRDTETPVGPRVIDALLGANAEDLAYIRSLYRGALAGVDTEIGRWAEALKQAGHDKDTVLVLTSSNGEGFRPDLKRVHHGGRLHDDLLHVPLMMRWPGRVAPGTVRTLSESIDIAPTLLKLAGLAEEPRFRGRPLVTSQGGFLSTFSGPTFLAAPRGQNKALAEESALRVLPSGKREASAVRQAALYSDWAKVIDAGDHVELYDVKADPGEERDAADTHAKAAEALRAELKRSVGEPGRAASSQDSAVQEQLRSLGYVQ